MRWVDSTPTSLRALSQPEQSYRLSAAAPADKRTLTRAQIASIHYAEKTLQSSVRAQGCTASLGRALRRVH